MPHQANKFCIAIHGGAGAISKKEIGEKLENEFHEALSHALTKGYEILKHKGSALDAVEEAVKILEDESLFNAGKGSVFTSGGENELDAAIMDGKTLNAGLVAGVSHIKNPVTLARKIMEQSPHVMLIGKGAEDFAKKHHIEIMPAQYFYTEKQWQKLQRAKLREQNGDNAPISEDEKHGTVGAVALDQHGHLAAATSTGGMTNKHIGRVGDSPILGAGTYANNKSCAVSATGHGEFFIRLCAAHEISSLMLYKNLSLEDACNEVIMKELKNLGGTGGVIAIDKNGEIAMPFNTEGMYRGFYKNGKLSTAIY